MTLASTTLAATCGLNDTSIVVTSATSFAAGNVIICEKERMRVVRSYTSGTTVGVLRGIEGTATAAHANGTGIMQGIGAADFPAVGPTETVDGQQLLGGWNAADVTATGATGTTATVLSAVTPLAVTVTGVSGAGVALQTGAAQPGAIYLFKNMTTGVLKIYAVGGSINGTTGTTAVSVTATGNIGALIMCTVPGAWQVVPIPT